MIKKIIDLRSDTVTKPSPEMREQMISAEVGDDVFEEDPNINLLQKKVAGLLGMESGLYVPSGTMSNQLAIKTHTQPGQEIICDKNCHIYNYEGGGISFLSGCQVNPLIGENGIIKVKEIEDAIRPDDIHAPPTSLIALENTHNRAGGRIFPLEEIKKIRILSIKRKIPLHLDGARLFNASVATGIPISEYGKYFDSVSICFSKGLGAPVGSVLSGGKEFIKKARHYRKVFGGGMRQAGILASACLFALENNVKRLKEDHDNATLLAQEIKDLSGLYIDLKQVETNILMIYVRHSKYTSNSLVEKLHEEGVASLAIDNQRIRVVTHLNISRDDIIQTANIFKKILG